MDKKSLKDINYYLNLPWTYTLETDKDNDGKKFYILRVNELPGVMTDAYTTEEALELIKEPMQAVFEIYMEQGKEIPEPKKPVY